MNTFSKIIKSLLIFIWIAFFAIGIITNHARYRIADCIALIVVAVLPFAIYLIIKIVHKNTAVNDYVTATTEYVPSDMPEDIAKEMRKHYTLMQAKRDAEIMSESFKLASSTLNLDVFCMRHDLATQKAHTLLQAEKAIVRNIKKLNCHKACIAVINASNSLKLRMLVDYEQHNFEQIENLKTKKGKINRYKKMLSDLTQAEKMFKDIPEYKMLLSTIELRLSDSDLSNATENTIIANITVASDNSSAEINSQPCSFSEYQIPNDIMSLLWIKDKTSANVPNLINEPSLIDLSLPIENGPDLWNTINLDYYPSYSSILPEQRSVYLNWLEDITKPIPIGYVFLFYYGLERYLFTEKSEDAVNMILELRKYHQNISFDSYSSDALTAYAISKDDDDLLKKILYNLNDISYLWSCRRLRGFLTPDDIVRTYRLWGFTNKRYICGENGLDDLFIMTLEEILVERYEESFLRIDEISVPKNEKLILANTSLPISMKEFSITDITKSTELSSCILELLTETHERVKVKAREIRKLNQYIN